MLQKVPATARSEAEFQQKDASLKTCCQKTPFGFELSALFLEEEGSTHSPHGQVRLMGGIPSGASALCWGTGCHQTPNQEPVSEYYI